jgi:hypothetical protein
LIRKLSSGMKKWREELPARLCVDLGLTIETVSRALTILRDQRLLRFSETTQRQLVLLDRIGLAKHGA